MWSLERTGSRVGGEHRARVELLEIGCESPPTPLQHTEQKHPPGVIKKQIILDLADRGGDIPYQRGAGDNDTGDAVSGGGGHGQLLMTVTCERCWLRAVFAPCMKRLAV